VGGEGSRVGWIELDWGGLGQTTEMRLKSQISPWDCQALEIGVQLTCLRDRQTLNTG
jgi:hypothetical protein